MAPRFPFTEAHTSNVTWRGHTANYRQHERRIMRELARAYPNEAAVVHEIKARLDATIVPVHRRRRHRGNS